MSYDTRPMSKGGNRGIDKRFSRKAPKGQFRLICVDTFDGTDWLQGDYETLREAQIVARNKGGEMLKTHIYNDEGKHVFDAGSF